ncbi:MAG TPA: hypothetical protein VNC78_08645 [Actinomycetota bacterium]|nr:hypothetical protein [Actinomycetota bacterium]
MIEIRRMLGSVAAACLLIGALAVPASATPAPASAPLPCGASGGMEIVQLRTFYVDVQIPKKTYRVGQTAIFNMTVTRPAHEDPLGNGIPVDPPQSEPAEGVSIGVGLIIDDVYLFGLGVTDTEGKSSIKVKLKSYTPAGMAQARAFAKKNVADSPCLVIDEIGYRPMPDAFKVIK